MKRSLSEIELELFKVIDEILWDDWDPIGVNTIEKAVGEYKTYVPEIIQMIRRGKTAKEISEYLSDVETNFMGLECNRENNEKVAIKLLSEYHKIKASFD